MNQDELTEHRLSRYLLVERLDDQSDPASELWRGLDEVLDRPVAVRLLDRDDPRAAAFIGAARAAALVDDRRLLRILDILETGTPELDDVIAVVSEWGSGRTLVEVATAASPPMRAADATALVAEIARAISAGLDTNVSHGRLRPQSVFVTDALEVRVRGLAVDAALKGQLDPSLDKAAADVDALGCLLYLLVTGRWPGTPIDGLPSAERVGTTVLAPSRVDASVPRAVDDVIARSIRAADRPRNVKNIADARGFAAFLSVARDRVEPVPHVRLRSERHPLRRTLVTVLALIAISATGLLGWRVLTSSGQAADAHPSVDEGGFLTTAATPATVDIPGIEQVLPIISVRSFDPFGDDNRDGKRDRRKGRENEEAVGNIVDGDAATTWRSNSYNAPDAGKGGVGVILDLGEPQSIRAVDLHFAGVGAAVDVRVADEILPNPLTWALLAQAPAGGVDITLRAPRALDGQYVLLWFPELPLVAGTTSTYRVELAEVQVRG